MTTLTTDPAIRRRGHGMTAAAGVDFVLIAGVAALTALIARVHKLRQRPDEGQGAGSPPSRAASVSGGSEPRSGAATADSPRLVRSRQAGTS